MSTPNFAYKNRCIVVSDDDFDSGNKPETEDRTTNDSNRSYPSFALIDQPNCKVLIAILTSAYYSGACIDYIENDRDDMTEEEYQKQIEIDTPIMNEFLDKLKTDYGFEEYRCIAIASNGEGFYESVK
jgi:hypothetical protein